MEAYKKVSRDPYYVDPWAGVVKIQTLEQENTETRTQNPEPMRDEGTSNERHEKKETQASLRSSICLTLRHTRTPVSRASSRSSTGPAQKNPERIHPTKGSSTNKIASGEEAGVSCQGIRGQGSGREERAAEQRTRDGAHRRKPGSNLAKLQILFASHARGHRSELDETEHARGIRPPIPEPAAARTSPPNLQLPRNKRLRHVRRGPHGG